MLCRNGGYLEDDEKHDIDYTCKFCRKIKFQILLPFTSWKEYHINHNNRNHYSVYVKWAEKMESRRGLAANYPPESH